MIRSLPGGLFGETWGDGSPKVVALHGWRRTHADFSGALGPGAPDGISTVAPDLPGFGATPPPPEAWGSEEYAAVVAQVIASGAAAGSKAVVVGHSLGGRVAATLAAGHPSLVQAVVLTGAPLVRRLGGGSKSPVGFRTIRTLNRLGLVGEGRLESARSRYGSADYRSAHGVMREVLVRLVNETYDDVLAAIECPVELVWGEDDREVPPSVAEGITARVRHANLTLCPGVGHLLPLERPAELRAAVDRAIANS